MRCRVSASGPGLRRARAALALVAAATIVIGSQAVARARSESPIRGYWAPRSALTSIETIRRALASAQFGGFDTVFVPIPLAESDPLPGFDGVRELIREARDRRLRVHAWLDVNRVVVDDEIPASRTHVIYQHPEWLMVPRALAPHLIAIDPRGPAYLGQLSRWTRANISRVDGLYVSPLDPEAAGYLANLVSTTLKRYVVDGVYLDGLRFPGSDFDYSRHAMDLFRAHQRPRLSPADRLRLDEIETIDPFGYASEFPAEWTAFRQARLTALVKTLRETLKINGLTVTANVPTDDETAREEQFQDWRTWVADRLIDGVGKRNGNSTMILLSTEGALPASSTILPVAGQASAGGSR
jgi:uncharacterized lipoprotein YddW (UPF0748 family)